MPRRRDRRRLADVPAPLTYCVVQAHFAEGANSVNSLGLDLARVLHGQSSWTYHRIPVAGDVLKGTTVVSDVYMKPGRQGGEMTFIEMETTYRDPAGEPVVTEKMTVIETALVVSA
ncbi:MAG: MaoC family dehydratase N-terminal domain-containing protein [Acidimicrobiales bacterium]|nr:MaoC family dehydratase N-terminal domain-containing protein [Acidimicrobiales bacterium]